MTIIIRWAIILILIFVQFNAKAADNYAIGDTLYVWAKSGLNLRKGPSARALKNGGVMFGAYVIIEEKTKVGFNVDGVADFHQTNISRPSNPIIFYGNWVKVTTEEGSEGFVIDQYLLPIKPNIQYEADATILPLELLHSDTVYAREEITDGEGLNYRINQSYDGDVKVCLEQGGVWSGEVYLFNGRSIEEVLVILAIPHNGFEDILVEKYWPNEIILSFEGVCEYKITKFEETVRVDILCSC